MLRGTLAAVAASLTWPAPVAACTRPYEEMPFDVWSYGKQPRILIREGDCVIDPGFWVFTPPPTSARIGRRIAL